MIFSRDELLFFKQKRVYVGQGTGIQQTLRGKGRREGRVRETWRVSSLSGLRIVFIARSLSLTANFYSVSLHKSAYDILCAPARKIVRNFSRPGGTREGGRGYSQFFNLHPGPAAAGFAVRFLATVSSSRVVAFCARAFFFFFFSPTHFYFPREKVARTERR